MPDKKVQAGAGPRGSRSLTRTVRAYLPNEAKPLAQELVVRHSAYVHALRWQLRKHDPAVEVRRMLGREDVDALNRRHPANGLLDGSTSGSRTWCARGGSTQSSRARSSGCWSICPMRKAVWSGRRTHSSPPNILPKYFTRLFCILLPIGLVETLGAATLFGSAVAGFIFLAVLQIGDDLVDPFANSVHDLPLTSVTSMVEGDLCQALGKEPPLLTPVDGVL
jgi:ion channel-forming bestrophin family protein